MDLLRKPPSARVVTVSSAAHLVSKGLDLGDLQLAKTDAYSP